MLIDRIKAPATRHACYEEDPDWHSMLQVKLNDCDYRRGDLSGKTLERVRYQGYSALETTDFDVLVVDGPRGVDHYSRFDCVPLVLANARRDYLIIVDDADRPGETETIRYLVGALRKRGDDIKLSYGRGRFRYCAYYF